MRNKYYFFTLMILFLVILLVKFLFDHEKIDKIAFISDSTISDSLHLYKAISSTYGDDNVEKYHINNEDEKERKEVLGSIKNKNYNAIIFHGGHWKSEIVNENYRSPVILINREYSKFAEVGEYENFFHIIYSLNYDHYVDFLLSADEKMDNIGVLFDSDLLDSKLETETLAEEIRKKLNVQVTHYPLSPLVCKQMGDIIRLLGEISDTQIKCLFIHEGGMINKYLSSILDYCKKKNITVIGGGHSALQFGSELSVGVNYKDIAEHCLEIVKMSEDGIETSKVIESDILKLDKK